MRPQDIKYSNLPLGVSLTLAEIILLLVIAGLVKLTAPQISIMTALAARYLFCLPLLLMVGIHLHGMATLRPSRPGRWPFAFWWVSWDLVSTLPR